MLWLFQVVLLVSVSLLNNWAFGFRVPLAIQILIRSAGMDSQASRPLDGLYMTYVVLGLVVAMCIGYLFLQKRYTRMQVVSCRLHYKVPSKGV